MKMNPNIDILMTVNDTLGEPSIKKNSLIDDIVQIGWVGHGLKPHFLKERNMDNYKGRVGQKSICPYFKN